LDRPTGQLERRTLTPAVLASALFVVASALFAVTFIASRGGLEMPVSSRGLVRAGSPEPTGAQPIQPPRPGVTAPAATDAPTHAPPAASPNDPLLSLPRCPDRPGCFVYVTQGDDTMSGIASRFLVSLAVVLALNPEISEPSVIEPGTSLFLGRDPFVRLEPCPDEPACSLYVVASGETLAEIAARYGLSTQRIRDHNPGLPRPLVAGHVIELPHPG
jgi:hypothetical protein